METKPVKNPSASILAAPEFYHFLYNNSRDAIMVLLPGQGFIAGNKATIDLFRCKDEKGFIAQTPASLSPKYQPDGRLSTEKSEEMMDIAKKTGSNFFEWTHCRVDGENFPATVLLTWLEENGVGFMLATVRDATKIKEAERKLVEANEYLNSLFDFAIAPTVVWNSDFTIARFNRSFERLTGRRAADVIGQPIEILFAPDTIEKPTEMIQKTLWQTVEINVPHVSGTVRNVLWDSATISIGGNKAMVSTITQGQDITDYKKLENNLKSKIEELERVNKIINSQLESLQSKIRGI
jgi:PAS domain S-box-containing protein